MTQKDAEAIEGAVMAAAASVVSGLLVVLSPGPRPIPEGWVNDTIRERVRAALRTAVETKR